MARNSIGQFIAALRKANGMTQQEVAERLNVSNKAVSRWERDECAPDLLLIPALAEMFDVTCDELLKGERIIGTSPQEKKEPKVEKQVKSLINRTLSSFKTLICISLALSAVALICMFGISYGFYRPIIGFAVMLLFDITAVVLAVLAVNKAKSVKEDNEVFEEADESLTAKFNNVLGKLSFAAFFASLSVVLLSLPLILFTNEYVESVLTFKSYCSSFFGGIVLIMVLLFLMFKKIYIEWVTDNRSIKEPINKKVQTMSMIQIGLLVIASVFGIASTYFESGVILEIPFLVFLIAVIGCFVVFLLKNKEERKEFVLPGIRNIILIFSIHIFSLAHVTVWTYYDGDLSQGVFSDYWRTEYLWYTVVFVVLVFVVFSIIDIIIKKTHKNN